MTDHRDTEPSGDLLDHEYDGIREYDNPCPGWWKWIFFLTFVFAPFYFFYFHVGRAGVSVEKAHQNSVSDNQRLRYAEIGELALDEATLLEYMYKEEWLKVGNSVYQQNCRSCHGDLGVGLVGPNLTDDHYKNVEKLGDVLDVVRNGAANGSMPAWNRLYANDILLVSAYAASLRGTSPPGLTREPEGKEIPPWPDAPVSAPPAEDAPTTDSGEQAPADASPPDAEDAPADTLNQTNGEQAT